MDTFVCFDGSVVDLDDPETFRRPEWGQHNTTMKLHQWAWSEMGKSLYYMAFFHPDWDIEQRRRVDQYCYWYAREYRNYFEDTEKNRTWFRKFIFRFLDEVENQC